MTQTVALFGFGGLGMAVARRLRAKGYGINAWNRTPEKLIALAEQGVIVKSSAAEAIKSADTLISALPDAAALQEVLFDKDWAHELHGRSLINLGSVNPSRGLAIMDAFHAHQAGYIEVAALGSVADVPDGNLQLMVGATEQEFNQVHSLLQDLSGHVVHVGDVGNAVAIKLAMQQLTASLFCAFSSSISMIKEQGLNVDVFMDFLRSSPLYTPMFDQKLPRILGRDYTQSTLPGKHLERELKLFLEEAEELGLNAHHVESVKELISFSVGRGMRDMDFTAVHDVINPPKDEE